VVQKRLGLDAGAVFVKTVVLDEQGRVVSRQADRHQGDPVKVARRQVADLKLPGPVGVGVTGVNGRLIAEGMGIPSIDFVQAEIRVVRERFPDARNIINVGGGSVTLIQLDESGGFLDYTTNSLCAAGTGSFLDQQAQRLGIGYDDLESFPHHDDPPSIATRCSVFAKTDLIHRQQEGYGKSALWSGLCKGMTGTFLNTLLRGRPLSGETVVTGGVSQNREVMRWLRERYGEQVRSFDDATFCSAIGAAELAERSFKSTDAMVDHIRDTAARAGDEARRPPLEFRKTKYPSFDVAESYVDEAGNEVRITAWPDDRRIPCFMGIDVGSTSTKLVLIDEAGSVLCDVYRTTDGAPIDATKHLFNALLDICRTKGCELKVLGLGTTGSGRKLVGLVVGADIIHNEITAHLAGALHFDPEVDTIFEIGGQDAKYIRARNGHIRDSNMNYVCAAGTGSFVEEQARKLGFKLDEIGDVVMGIAPPITSDRCTVFMEQDVDRLVRAGYTQEECIAAVLYSVVQNYFNKVVGNRHYSRRKIFFQGATARNRGLVAAFENLLDVEMVVSPYCHVMGALGVALIIRERAAAAREPSTFKGLDLSRRKITLRSEECRLCANHCKITFAEIEGDSFQPSWGYMCGRDPEDTKVRLHDEFMPFRQRLNLLFQQGRQPEHPRGTVVIPRALHAFSMYPLWRTFLQELGYRVRLTERTNEQITRLGIELTAGDFCFPVKIAHGHAAVAMDMEDADFVLLPHVINAPPNPSTTNSVLCPCVEAFPSIVRSTLRLHDVDVGRMLRPVIDFDLDTGKLVKGLHEEIGSRLGVTRAEVRRAWLLGCKARDEFERASRGLGRKILTDLEADDERAIVLLGRPYNVLDLGSNLGLPQKIADLGIKVIPLDLLPFDSREINPVFDNMFWVYGQYIMCAAEMVRNHPNLFAVYFTNFACGPDSFILSFVEDVMGDKPFLILEVDEHGGDAGYMTRVEAFLDVVKSSEPVRPPAYTLPRPVETPDAFRRKRLWIPPMHPAGTPLMAAAMRGHGYDAQPLPPEDVGAFECGRSLTRGSECLPAVLTTGAIVQALRESCSEGECPYNHALFMPSASGPCRFGQYGLLQRIIFNDLGYDDVPILSPTSENAYGGLSQQLRVDAWKSIVSADILWKCRCKVRPYETREGDAEEALAAGIRRLIRAFENRGDVEAAVVRCVRDFERIPVREPGAKPLVGIVGEIYVRCNQFANDNLIEFIENHGGEAWLTPLSEWILYTAYVQRHMAAKKFLNWKGKLDALFKNKFLERNEHRYYGLGSPLLDDRREPPMRLIVETGARRVPVEFYGEAILTLGRAEIFARRGADMIVNAAPFGCMPGTITSALCREIQTETNVPIVSMFYDGEGGINDRLGVFFHNLAGRPRSRETARVRRRAGQAGAPAR